MSLNFDMLDFYTTMATYLEKMSGFGTGDARPYIKIPVEKCNERIQLRLVENKNVVKICKEHYSVPVIIDQLLNFVNYHGIECLFALTESIGMDDVIMYTRYMKTVINMLA